jgi:hypothetical protein
MHADLCSSKLFANPPRAPEEATGILKEAARGGADDYITGGGLRVRQHPSLRCARRRNALDGTGASYQLPPELEPELAAVSEAELEELLVVAAALTVAAFPEPFMTNQVPPSLFSSLPFAAPLLSPAKR